MIFCLIAVALFDLPQAVILPGQHMVGVSPERALVPDLRQLVVAELAIGIADQIGDVRVIVMTERLELDNSVSIIVAVIDRRIGVAIAPRKSRIIETGLLVLFLGLLGGAGTARGGLPAILRRRGHSGRISAAATAGGKGWNQRRRRGKRHGE